MGNLVPVIMEVNPLNGTVEHFISVEKIGTNSTNVPTYYTFGAIYHDISDPHDGKAYYYAGFIMNDIMQMVKINVKEHKVLWNYQY